MRYGRLRRASSVFGELLMIGRFKNICNSRDDIGRTKLSVIIANNSDLFRGISRADIAEKLPGREPRAELERKIVRVFLVGFRSALSSLKVTVATIVAEVMLIQLCPPSLQLHGGCISRYRFHISRHPAHVLLIDHDVRVPLYLFLPRNRTAAEVCRKKLALVRRAQVIRDDGVVLERVKERYRRVVDLAMRALDAERKRVARHHQPLLLSPGI